MKNKLFFFALISGVLVLAAAFLGSADPMVAMAFAGVIGVPMAGAITTLDGDSADMNREDISSSVVQMMPSRTPLDTIMRNVKKAQRAYSQKIGYYQASYKPVRDNLDGSAAGDGSSVGVPASCYTYDSGAKNEITSIFVRVKDTSMWRNNDTLLMRDLELSGSFDNPRIDGVGSFLGDVMFYVASKSSAVLELVPVGGVKGSASGANKNKFVVPSFPTSQVLYRMGQAKSELSIMTEPFAIYPSINWQYCQNFMAQIEESTFQRLTQKEVSWGFSNFEAVNILSMKMEMELSMLFGNDGEYVVGNDRTYFTRGIVRDITQTLEYGTGAGDTTVTRDQYNNWLKRVFDGNNGSSNRVLFAGSGLIKALSVVEDFQKSMLSVDKDATLGVDVRKIQTYFGTLNIVLAPLLKEVGWENNGIILDLEHITKHEFVPMSVTDLDLKRAGNKNADARVIQEVSCLTLRYPDCHAVIKPAI